MPAHTQAWVKVNAQVDCDLLDLITALSLFPTLQTIESCQGEGVEPAWVCFSFGGCWKESAAFVLGFLAPRLSKRVGDGAALVLRPRQWGELLVDLSVRREALEATSAALIEIAGEFSAYRLRNSACSGGMSDTSPGHC